MNDLSAYATRLRAQIGLFRESLERGLHSIKRGLHSIKRGLYSIKKGLYSMVCETKRLLYTCNDSFSCVTRLIHHPRMRMNLLTATFLIKRVLHSIKRALMTYWCDTFHSYHSSLMSDDELPDCHVSIRKSLTFYQNSPTFIQKSPDDLFVTRFIRIIHHWWMMMNFLTAMFLFERVLHSIKRALLSFKRARAFYQGKPVPDMLNFRSAIYSVKRALHSDKRALHSVKKAIQSIKIGLYLTCWIFW